MVAAIVCAALVMPASASAAYVYSIGGAKKFGGSVSSGVSVVKTSGKYYLKLKPVLVWQFKPSSSFDPRSAQRLSNGRTLVADTASARVVEYDGNGDEKWAYAKDLVTPYSAQRLASSVSGKKGNTLIVDRGGRSVIEVDADGNTVWRYGTGTASLDPGNLMDPVYAVRLAGGNTLICDNEGAHRVIEVNSAGDIVWRYGTDGLAPRHAQRLTNNNTLIADEDGHRVMEVNISGTVVWQFGKTGVSGTDLNRLKRPVSAQRQTDGSTLISDSGNSRLLRVSSDLKKVEKVDTASFGSAGGLDEPQTALFTPSGTVLVADQANHRLLEFGNATSGRYTSAKLDLGTAGVKKRITRIDAISTRPASTAVKLQYSVDGGSWKSVGGPTITFPAGLNATSVRVRTDLTTTNRDVTPVVNSVMVTYELFPTVGTSTTAWGQLYGPFTFGGTTAAGGSSATKAPGAAGALPQANAVPGVAATTLYSGFLMQRVANGAQMTKDTRGLPGLPIEAAGTAAALLLMTTVYGLGLASTTLSRVAHGALEALKSVMLRSM